MRIVLFANNWAGWQIAAWLQSRGENIVGLVLHPPSERKFGNEIIVATGLDDCNIYDGSLLRSPDTANKIRSLAPDIGISLFFGYILRREILELLPSGCINVHPAFLPYNRGASPNIWSIVENTPAGATVHYIDEGVDTGDIIAQREVAVEPTDTGESLYKRLERCCVDLFTESWISIRNGTAVRKPQTPGGSVHRRRDVAAIDEIDLDRTYVARNLINILRARTFPPYKSAYFKSGNTKIFVKIQLQSEDEQEQGNPMHSGNSAAADQPGALPRNSD